MKTAVLVIKLGALGDFVQALGPFAAIRRRHAGAHLVLLTTPPYADFARRTRLFDDVWIDDRPRPWEVRRWLALRRWLRGSGFARVYDLQTSDRSSFYFRLFWPEPVPEWSGIARGCSHPHANPQRDAMHTVERQAEQLRMAGISDVPAPDLTFAEAEPDRFGLPNRFALLAPGGAAHRPEKRWPPERFAALARRLAAAGATPVLIGGPDEADLHRAILPGCDGAVSLAGRTGIADVAGLARSAALAVGNDTGPMHLVAAAGCPAIVLYSHASDPALCAPRGPQVTILRRSSLTDLEEDTVWRAASHACREPAGS